MTETKLEPIADVVRQACQERSNAFGYGIWTHHIREVARLAVDLAAEFGADAQVVEAAAYLHDYAAVKDVALYHEHHVHSAREAERLLKAHGYPKAKIKRVVDCILEHRASVPSERRTPEARCLATADALAHLEQVPALLYYAYVKAGMTIDDGRDWVREKLARSYGKLEPRWREAVRSRYEAALLTLQPARPVEKAEKEVVG